MLKGLEDPGTEPKWSKSARSIHSREPKFSWQQNTFRRSPGSGTGEGKSAAQRSVGPSDQGVRAFKKRDEFRLMRRPLITFYGWNRDIELSRKLRDYILPGEPKRRIYTPRESGVPLINDGERENWFLGPSLLFAPWKVPRYEPFRLEQIWGEDWTIQNIGYPRYYPLTLVAHFSRCLLAWKIVKTGTQLKLQNLLALAYLSEKISAGNPKPNRQLVQIVKEQRSILNHTRVLCTVQGSHTNTFFLLIFMNYKWTSLKTTNIILCCGLCCCTSLARHPYLLEAFLLSNIFLLKTIQNPSEMVLL